MPYYPTNRPQDDEELDRELDNTPYDSISNNPPAELPNEALSVRDTIAQKFGTAQKGRFQNQMNTLSNLGQSFDAFSRGVNAPVSNASLYENMAKQNAGTLDMVNKDEAQAQKLLSEDEARAQKVKEAIANRELRQKEIDRQAARDDQASKDRRYMADAVRAGRGETSRVAQDFKTEKELNENIQKFEKRMGEVRPAEQTIEEIERSLGFALDDAYTRDDEIYVNGKKKDLPGVSVPLLGRVSAYSSGARNLAAAADKLFNITLKDRSGASITPPEFQALKREFEQGKFNTEPELISGMQRAKRAIDNEIRSRKAGFSPEVLAVYEERLPPKKEFEDKDDGSGIVNDAIAAPPLKVGTIKKGYRYIGGNASKPESWEKL